MIKQDSGPLNHFTCQPGGNKPVCKNTARSDFFYVVFRCPIVFFFFLSNTNKYFYFGSCTHDAVQLAAAKGRPDSIKKILNLRSSLFVQLLLWGRTGGEGNKKVPKSEAANRMR